ncbi:DNA-directed RNA polymerase III subunit RPC4 [Holothuria leucospilota]|uniref:DNA-directed RNA polymerase III subunit RPC4 n=1 Tax=Holothuria leucospilota TaxID=206669 RepID=A0A9Q0YP32_HOLLE|nr:DNA-directed RNA polymerase III subunit RPC4 [Holothuria leucospilota]
MAENNKPSSSSSTAPIKLDTLTRGLVGRKHDLMNPTARLPSLRTPRDLTLKNAVKKSFKPNIPVRRERPKEDGDAGSRSSSPGPSKIPKGNGRGRGRGKRGAGARGGRDRNKELIQTHNSIFEEGPGDRLVRRSTTEGFGRSSVSSRGDSVSSGSLASSFRSLNLKREEREEEDSKRIAELLRDDFVKDGRLTVDDRYKPISLPLKTMAASSSSSSSSSLQDITDETDASGISIKQEPMSPPPMDVKVKQEPPDSDEEMPLVDEKKDVKPKIFTKVKGSEPKKSTLPLFSRRDALEGKLLFFQLPDSLPALPPTEDEDRSLRGRSQEVQGTSSQGTPEVQSQKTVKNECTLNDLPAGFLGKIRIRKSGKTELRLGNITLDVSVGTPCGFLQDVVSVKNVQDHQEIINLGPVKHRIICTPNLMSLLENR